MRGQLIVNCLSFLVVSAANAQAKFERAITVTGSCLRSVVPDRSSVVVVADVLKPDLQTASNEAMDVYNKMRKAVQGLNLKDLELATSESTFQEEREWQKDRAVFKGFRARMGLKVSTSEVSRLGEVIAIASKHGIRQISSLSTFVSPERSKAERESCLEEAMKNARAKADIVAKAASAKVGKILEVTEQPADGGIVVPPMRMRTMKAEMQAADAPVVEAGSEKMTVNIIATFGID